MDRDWANLDALVLSLILDKLIQQIDHVWFGAVCKNWCSVAKLNHQSQQLRRDVLPMLMIPMERKNRIVRNLYDIPSNRVYDLQLSVPFSGRCSGFSHGWLAIVDPNTTKYVITLINPFKNVAPISLPPIKANNGFSRKYSHQYEIHKVILSADPVTSPNDYVVVAIHGSSNKLAFIKAGQQFWTYQNSGYLTDVTIYNGLIYSVSLMNKIFSSKICYSSYPSSGSAEMPPMIHFANRGNYYSSRAYLGKSLEGDLWLVYRYSILHEETLKGSTESFDVYKLELDAQNGKVLDWLKLESLGDNVLFLGDNESIAVSASNFSNCIQNESIYFTDDYYGNIPISYSDGRFDMGIYNVKDGSIQRYPYKPLRKPPPIWVLPAFKWD